MNSLGLSRGNSGAWTMRDGREIAVSDMSDGHLVNACRILLRRAWLIQMNEVMALGRLLWFVHGEAAQDAVEADSNFTSSLPPDDYLRGFSKYSHMFQEANRRGLSI